MERITDERFDTAAALLHASLGGLLLSIPAGIKRKAQEIRLRAEQPLSLGCGQDIYFLSRTGRLLCEPGKDAWIVSREMLDSCFQLLCSFSVYSHENEIRQGYLSLQGGHRAGICGTAVYQGGTLTGLRDISSICLRISRQIPDCSLPLLQRIGERVQEGILLVGPPSSGKTTVLRDLARCISSGEAGEIRRVSLVDERGELAGMYQGVPRNDLGPCCDVLNGYGKADGILQAVRTLSPDYVVCDEVGGVEDTRSLLQCLHAGVTVIASMHAGSPEEFLRKQQARILLEAGAFSFVAFLGGRKMPGTVEQLYEAGDLLAQIHRNDADDYGGNPGGTVGIV